VPTFYGNEGQKSSGVTRAGAIHDRTSVMDGSKSSSVVCSLWLTGVGSPCQRVRAVCNSSISFHACGGATVLRYLNECDDQNINSRTITTQHTQRYKRTLQAHGRQRFNPPSIAGAQTVRHNGGTFQLESGGGEHGNNQEGSLPWIHVWRT